MRASDGRERARMTYAERSYLYILRRAVRRNLRGCHRHSSPTYLPTALLLPLHPPVVRTILTRSHPFLYFIVLFLSLFCFPGAFTDSLAFLISFSAFLFCFFFFLFAVLHFGNIKSLRDFYNFLSSEYDLHITNVVRERTLQN